MSRSQYAMGGVDVCITLCQRLVDRKRARGSASVGQRSVFHGLSGHFQWPGVSGRGGRPAIGQWRYTARLVRCACASVGCGNHVCRRKWSNPIRGRRQPQRWPEYLVRSRQKWVDQGIAVVIPNRPASVSEFNFRLTDAYSHDIVTLIDFASSRWSAPIWLLGHSLGSLAVVSGASGPSATKVAGIVVAGGTFFTNGVKQTVYDTPLAAVHVPVLITEHEHETCGPSSPEGAASFRTALIGSLTTDLMLFTGGEPSGGPCDPTALHSYVGLDAQFVARVSAWMRDHNGKQ